MDIDVINELQIKIELLEKMLNKEWMLLKGLNDDEDNNLIIIRNGITETIRYCGQVIDEKQALIALHNKM